MAIKSLDPRITRANIEAEKNAVNTLDAHDHWQTYEVFTQEKRGDKYVHVGSLHAPNNDMAWVLAKEQFGRRNKCTGLWVVKTTDIFTGIDDEEEMFERNQEKIYREAGGYKVMERINKYKKGQK
ncbi:MAG TPA: 1,2-phenylacetyl-CoA epoxidase subunit PaaB [Ignavibacteria bacterium]|nr:1,2-phenylacetyl-CoA epoxidase subunit PaaB [Ignavibacteria bacterium]